MATSKCSRALYIPKTTIRPSTRPLFITQLQRLHITSRIPPQSLVSASLSSTRHASSSSTTTSQSSPSSPQTPDNNVVTWDKFFEIRRKRRYTNLIASLCTSAAAVGIFGPIIAQQDIDGWAASISGLDPLIVLGITTFAAAGAGWLCGPTFGNQGFKLAYRNVWGQVKEKEKSFFERVKRYRADPSSSSPQNPIPDYYGEKIASVRDYRRWLKDQRAFNLKKNKNML